MRHLFYRPLKVLWNLIKNTFRSCLWLSTYIALYRYGFCFYSNLLGGMTRTSIGLAGFTSGFGLLWEPYSRRTEMALYFFPRVVEASWGWMKKVGWVASLPYGEVLVFAFAMAILMYQNELKDLKRSSYLSFFKYLCGQN